MTTWLRESNGLFDYDSRTTTRQALRLTDTSAISRTGDDCAVVSDFSQLTGGELLVRVIREEDQTDRFALVEVAVGASLWLVVRHRQPGTTRPLMEGDVIKCGKVSLFVRRLRGSSQSPVVSVPRSLTEKTATNVSDAEESQKQCRVCLGDSQGAGNPFLSLCSCTGSLAWIHLMCLREWLKNKMSSRETERVVTYSWQPPVCELCKTPLPDTASAEGITYDLVDYHRADSAYILLEEGNGVEAHHGSAVHVGSLSEGQSLSIVLATQGRGHRADIRIGDISVSRLHAEIRFSQGRFYLDDKGSKFGTLLQARDMLEIPENGSVQIQVNRTLLTFAYTRTSRCCLLACLIGLRNRGTQRVSAVESVGIQSPSPLLAGVTSQDASIMALVVQDLSSVNESRAPE